MTTDSSLADILLRHGITDMSEEEFLTALDQAFEAANTPQPALSEEEQNTLGRYTADLPADRIDHRRALDDLATRRVVDLYTSTMSTRQAAEHLGVDRTTVTRRIVRGSLFGVRVDDRYRLPLWQFVAPGGTLPGLATIIGAIPDRYPLTMLDEYLHAPREEFDGRSILAHLADGGAPEDAARLLDQLDRW